MTRWIKIIFLLSFSVLNGRSQGLFSYENSSQFANYLFESGQFSLACEEYERVIFLKPQDSTSIGRLLESYRKTGRSAQGLDRAKQLISDRSRLDPKLFGQIYYLQLENQLFEETQKLIQMQTGIDESSKNLAEVGLLISTNKWKEASSTYQTFAATDKNPDLHQIGHIINEYLDSQKKIPVLAATMSAILPGAGKAYTGRWADGAIALLFIGSNAWQSYRGFEKDGIKSVRGWVFGAIGFGFWVGNIYGSYKTASQYNQSVMQKYHERASNILYHAF